MCLWWLKGRGGVVVDRRTKTRYILTLFVVPLYDDPVCPTKTLCVLQKLYMLTLFVLTLGIHQ